MKTTTNNKHTGNSSFTHTFMTGALLALLTLPTLGMAGQQTQLPSPKNTVNSHVSSNDVAENYGDINDEEETTVNKVNANPDIMSQRIASSSLMVAMNNETGKPVDEKAYGDNQDDG